MAGTWCARCEGRGRGVCPTGANPVRGEVGVSQRVVKTRDILYRKSAEGIMV